MDCAIHSLGQALQQYQRGAGCAGAWSQGFDHCDALRRSKLSDAALAAMAALTCLTELSLSGLSNRKVSGGAIGNALQCMPLLETVNLWYCRQARQSSLPGAESQRAFALLAGSATGGLCETLLNDVR